jgi:hypothetical protein
VRRGRQPGRAGWGVSESDAALVEGLTKSDGDVQATALRHAAGGAYSCSSAHPPHALRQMRRIGRAQDSRSAAPEKPDERVHLPLDPTLAIVILQVELPTSAAVETAKEPKRASKQWMCRTLLKSGDGSDGSYALSRTPTSSA